MKWKDGRHSHLDSFKSGAVLQEDGVESFLELSRKPKQSSCLIFLSAGIYACTTTQAGMQISVNMMACAKFAIFETNHVIPTGAQCFPNVDNELCHQVHQTNIMALSQNLLNERMEQDGIEWNGIDLGCHQTGNSGNFYFSIYTYAYIQLYICIHVQASS